MTLFWKCLKLTVDFENAVEKSEKIFTFLDNFIWIGSSKFSLLPGKYFLSGVNVLTSSLKISDITKKDFFQVQFSQSNEQSWQNYYRADSSSVWDPLTCWLSSGVLKRDSLDIYKRTYLAVYTFGKT